MKHRVRIRSMPISRAGFSFKDAEESAARIFQLPKFSFFARYQKIIRFFPLKRLCNCVFDTIYNFHSIMSYVNVEFFQ